MTTRCLILAALCLTTSAQLLRQEAELYNRIAATREQLADVIQPALRPYVLNPNQPGNPLQNLYANGPNANYATFNLARRNPACLLRKQEGNCNQQRLHYYYDVTSMMCLPFYYSGCGDNSNNFVDLVTCNQQCVTYAGSPNAGRNQNAGAVNLFQAIERVANGGSLSPGAAAALLGRSGVVLPANSMVNLNPNMLPGFLQGIGATMGGDGRLVVPSVGSLPFGNSPFYPWYPRPERTSPPVYHPAVDIGHWPTMFASNRYNPYNPTSGYPYNYRPRIGAGGRLFPFGNRRN